MGGVLLFTRDFKDFAGEWLDEAARRNAAITRSKKLLTIKNVLSANPVAREGGGGLRLLLFFCNRDMQLIQLPLLHGRRRTHHKTKKSRRIIQMPGLRLNLSRR